jgi:hypothetical protein
VHTGRGLKILARLTVPQLLYQVGDDRIAGEHEIGGCMFSGVNFLRHVGEAKPLQTLDVAAVSGQITQQQGEQAGLAAAVGAYQGDVLAWLQGDAGLAQQ